MGSRSLCLQHHDTRRDEPDGQEARPRHRLLEGHEADHEHERSGRASHDERGGDEMPAPAAAVPATAISQSAWPLTAISCPRARITRRTSAFVTRAPLVTTSAPSAAVTFVEPSLRQSVHVAAEAPASIANRTADVSTKVSLGRQSAQRFLSRPPAHGAHQYSVGRARRSERRKAQRGPGEARAYLGERVLIQLLEDLHVDEQRI